MKQIKEYVCDGYGVPTDEEIKECINITNNDNCIIQLHVDLQLGPSRIMTITPQTTFEEIKERLQDYIMR